MVASMHPLILEDPQRRVVFHEWPAFGAESEAAARVSLQRRRYWQVHTGIFGMRGRRDGAPRRTGSRAGHGPTGARH